MYYCKFFGLFWVLLVCLIWESTVLAKVPSGNITFNSDLAKWLTDNNWIGKYGSHNYSVITIPTAVSLASNVSTNDNRTLIKFHSGVGKFEVETTLDQDKNRLANCTLYLVIPGFGRALLLQNKTIPLSLKSSANDIFIQIPDTMVNGTIKFFYSNDNGEVLLSWNLTTPLTGADPIFEDDGYSLFPTAPSSNFLATKLQDVDRISDSDASTLRGLPLSEFRVVEGVSGKGVVYDKGSAELFDNQNAQTFIHDYVKPGAKYIALSANYSALGPSNIDSFFLDALELKGSITFANANIICSVVLSVNIPIIGSVPLITISGDLDGAGVQVTINVIAAQGTAIVFTKKNGSGTHELYIGVQLSVLVIGNIANGRVDLGALPF